MDETMDENGSIEAEGQQGASEAQDGAQRDLPELVEDLSCGNRRRRQEASHVIAQIAKDDPSRLEPYVEQLIDALYRPEAQTRWEILDALTSIIRSTTFDVAKAADGAESSLFDESSAMVRLASFRFLSRLGSTSPDASDQAWPLLDEAIQCYHGDPEYRDMLIALLDFAKADISEASRSALVDRISFDAESGRGYIRTCSAEIIAATKG